MNCDDAGMVAARRVVVAGTVTVVETETTSPMPTLGVGVSGNELFVVAEKMVGLAAESTAENTVKWMTRI